VKTSLGEHGVSHPRYSPDLAAEDFFISPMAKTAFKGKKFQDIEDIKKNVKAELNAVSLEAFSDCFQSLFERFNSVFKWVEITFNINKKFFIFFYFFYTT
jgi:hypothetical protein